jgi:23S rRNA pseudouridine1911/1915/1917 synthase
MSNINDFPEIIFEDDACLVINKPAGLAVHHGGNIEGLTLTDLLVHRYPTIAKVGDDPVRPGIVHRLDKDVSGLMVVAKTEKSFISLKEQFQKREINKQYLALVYGKVENDDDDICFPIKRSRDGYRMAAMPLNAADLLIRRSPKSRDKGNISGLFKAKEAITSFKVIKRFVNYTYLEVKIKTGRTHQIRVHFFAYGHPLVGDTLYFTKKTKAKNDKLSLGRVFLMASRLSFFDQAGEKKDFTINLAPELASFLPKF